MKKDVVVFFFYIWIHAERSALISMYRSHLDFELYASICWRESYAVGNFEAIIIEAIASFEEIDIRQHGRQ